MLGRSELNNMLKAIGSVFFCTLCILFIGWFVWFVFFYHDVGCDYKTTVEVNDSSKFELAISNAVKDIESRNFVVTKLEFETLRGRIFRVTCGGVDKENLLKRYKIR